MGSFLAADTALAGLKVLSVVDRKDRRMFASERVGRSGVRDSIGPHARKRPHPRRRPGKDALVEGFGVGFLDRAAATTWRNGSFVFYMA